MVLPPMVLKSMYSEKATKFCEISTLLLSYLAPVKRKVELSQNFVAFSEYMNFNLQYFTSKKFLRASKEVRRELKIQVFPHWNYEPFKDDSNLHSLKNLWQEEWRQGSVKKMSKDHKECQCCLWKLPQCIERFSKGAFIFLYFIWYFSNSHTLDYTKDKS